MSEEKNIPEQACPENQEDGGVVTLPEHPQEAELPVPEDVQDESSQSLNDEAAPSKTVRRMTCGSPAPGSVTWEEEPSPDGNPPEAESKGKKKPFWQTIWFWGAVIFALFLLALGSGKTSTPPLSLDLKATVSSDFSQTGKIYLTGFDRLTAEEIEAGLTIKPEVDFAVSIDKEDPQRAIITLESARNIAYELSFQMELEVPADESGPNPDVYRYRATVNGPQMTVRLSQNRLSSEYDPVILEFSDTVNVDSLEANLRVEPRTHYIIEYSPKTITLYPDESWSADRNYTITIGNGYKSLNGRQFAEPQTLSFRVAAKPPSYPFVEFTSDRSYILSESRDMTLLFNASDLKEKVPVIVETYRMPSIERYREQGHIYLNYDVPLDLLEKVDVNVYLIENGQNQFKLPHPGEGAYIVSATYTDPHMKWEVHERASYLITPLSVYMQATSRDTMVWINSSRTGGPLEGYTIYLGDSSEPAGVTDRDGMAFLDENAMPDPDRNSFRVHDPSGALVYYDYGVATRGDYQEERFYSYLFTDRTLYRPEDTVCFWGFAQPFRNNRLEMPKTVVVTFDPGGLDIRQELEISPDGVFHGEIELERIKSSQYAVQAAFYFPPTDESETGTTHVFENYYVSVKEFQKPAYTLSSEAGKNYYGPNDTVTVTASAAFYDGTPLPHFPVEVSYYDSAKYDWISLGTIETDDVGNAVFSFPSWQSPRSVGAGPTSGSYMVRIASDGEDITHVGRYTVFPSDILIDTRLERQPNGQNLSLTVSTYKLDLESAALKAEMEQLQDSGYYGYYSLNNSRLLQIARGAPVDAEDVRVSLRWDFVDQKGIRRRYVYDRNWGRVILFSNSYSMDYIVNANPGVSMKIANDSYSDEKILYVSTSGGSVSITDLIYLDEGAGIDFSRNTYCSATVSLRDGKNNPRSDTAYYPSASAYREDWGEEDQEFKPVPGYSFQVQNITNGTDITPENSWYRSISVNVGDTVRFNLLLDSIPADTDGKILYCIVQDGVYEHKLVSGNSFDLQYKMAYGTSFNLVAVYFDGHGTRAVKQIEVYATEASMGIDIEVTPDRDSYRPGDTVQLAVKATDSRGNGVAGNICVAVVDESIFALSEQYFDILWSLYYNVRWLDNSVRQYFTSYRDEVPDEYPGDGGKGEGDGPGFYDSYRSNFKDTAMFLPATTDAGGNAYLTFELPDNTTSWRITTVAVGDNLTAGSSKTNIISTLPFFCKPVMTSKYIEGDDFAMLVQGHGNLLDSDSDITYTVTVTGDNYSQTKTANGKAFTPQQLNFGKLPVGRYTVISRAQYGGYSDTVELPVSVIKSNLELVIHKEIELGETLDIEAMRYPVTVTFYDSEIQPFITSINSMFGHYCMQTSQRMSRVVAKQALRYSMPGETIPSYIADTSENISDMQNDDGGIGAYLDSTSDPLLTTYVLLVAKDQFNHKAMAAYYNRELERLTNPKEIAACHLGLAVIGQMDAKSLLEHFEGAKTLDVKAYYIAALSYIGETDTALKLYNEHCAPHVKDMYTKAPGSYSSKNPPAWERDDAACWIAASMLSHDDADALSLYFGSSSWRIRTLYECMIYVTYYDKVIEPSTLNYTIKDQPYSVRFGLDTTTYDYGYGYNYSYTRGSYMKTIVLSKSDLESLRFTDAPDNIRAVAYYIGEPSEIGLEPSDNMSISKSIADVDDNTYEVTLTIKLGKDAPLGQYDISDWVPSNTRIYGKDGSYQVEYRYTVNFSTRSEGQNLYVSFDNRRQMEQVILYKYRIRKTFACESALDTVYMIHGDTGENCNSQKSVFTTK